EDSPAAYSRASVHGHKITVQAQFTCDDPTIRSVEVRAVDNVLEPPTGNGCLGFLLGLLAQLLRALFGNVLGTVAPTDVPFFGGASGPVIFNLKCVRVGHVPVGIHTTEWRWQYRIGGGAWVDLEVTRHRIYVLVAGPTAPWQQAPYTPTNTQLPWTEVLDVACQWGML